MYVAADVDAVTDRDVFGHGVPPRAHFGGVLKDGNDLCRPNSPGCVEVVCLRFIKHGKGVRKRPKGLFHYKLFVNYSLFIIHYSTSLTSVRRFCPIRIKKIFFGEIVSGT